MLFSRNYFELTEDESARLKKATAYLERAKKKNNFGITADDLYKYHQLLPPAFYHNNSLFPNNYVLFDHERHGIAIEEKFNDFVSLIKTNGTTERQVLNYIKNTESYFILESLFLKYDFGHHDAYLFREFELPPNYIVDFLLVGKNSGGYEFIFVEFESPGNDITLKDGSLGSAFRNGIKQVEDWDLWIDSNFSALRTMFKKYKNPTINLPEEFYDLDKSRIHFLVIAGQRTDFNAKTYRLKRRSANRIKIKHYDNVIDEVSFHLYERHKCLKK